MRSRSHGVVRLNSSDPRRHPCMDPNYLSSEQDLIEFRRCIELSRNLFSQRAFDRFRGEDVAPGANCKTDEDVSLVLANAELPQFRLTTLYERRLLRPIIRHARKLFL